MLIFVTNCFLCSSICVRLCIIFGLLDKDYLGFCMLTFLIFNNILCGVFLIVKYTHKVSKLSFSLDNCTVYKNGEKITSIKRGSANYRFICYLFENINREITIKELGDNVFFGGVSSLSKIVSNTPLSREIINKHFTISNKIIIFKSEI